MYTQLRSVKIPQDQISEFCERWKIVELAVFGSALRDDFGPYSDIDLLVTFAPDATWTLLDHVTMQDQLKAIFGRKVDLINRRAIERSRNHIRRKGILGATEVIYGKS